MRIYFLNQVPCLLGGGVKMLADWVDEDKVCFEEKREPLDAG